MLFKKEHIRVKADDQGDEKAEGKSSAFVSKFLNVQASKVENLKRDMPRLPEPSEVFFLMSMQQFNAFTFVQYIARLYFIEELYATTYSVSMRVIEALQELQKKGRIGKINLLISDSMMKRNQKVCDAVNAWAHGNRNVSVVYTWNHSKFTLCKTPENWFLVEGSGNWGDNACYEQYVMANSELAYKARAELFTDCKAVYKIN